MFSRIKKKKISKAIRESCVKCFPDLMEYLQCLYDDLAAHENMAESDLRALADACIRNYMNRVADCLFVPLFNDPSKHLAFLHANLSPSVTGLPDEYTTEYIADNGFDASAVFAICYYMMTNKPVTHQDYPLMGALAIYQKELILTAMDNVAK